MKNLFLLSLVAALVMMVSSASAQVVFSDDFEVDSSADYTVSVPAGHDTLTTFSFDYGSGAVIPVIPEAPNSVTSATRGLVMAANVTSTPSATMTFLNQTLPSAYVIEFDVYHYYDGGSGSSEYTTFVMNGDAATTTPNFWQGGGPLPATGFEGYATTIRSDFASGIFDLSYHLGVDGAVSDIVGPTSSIVWADGDNSDNNRNNTQSPVVDALPNADVLNEWYTVTMRYDSTLNEGSFFINDVLQFSITDASWPSGQLGIGHEDPFGSINSAFTTIIDNLVVTQVTTNVQDWHTLE